MSSKRDRQELIKSYDQLEESIDRLTELLRRQRKACVKTKARLETGSSIRTVFTAIPTGDLRLTLTEALASVEAGRHRVRRLAFKLGLDEGMTIGELARIWGFSRQLAARYAKEAKRVSA